MLVVHYAKLQVTMCTNLTNETPQINFKDFDLLNLYMIICIADK